MQFSADNLRFSHSDDMLGSQLNGVIVAYDRDTLQPLGYVEYCIFDDDHYVNMIEVSEAFRRQGVAERLVRELLRYENVPFPKLRWGLTTSVGSQLYHTLSRRMG